MAKLAREGNYGIDVNYYSDSTTTTKRINANNVMSIQGGEDSESCVTCGCSIF